MGACLFTEKPRISVKYDYIIDYLCSTAGPAIEGAGATDERVNKRTEAGIAESLRRYICGEEGDSGNDYFRADQSGLLYIYNGKFFERMNDIKFLGIIRNVLRKMQVGLVYSMDSAKRIADYCREALMQETRCQFNPDRRYVCFNNCVLDLKTMRVSEHSFKYCTDIIMNFDYDMDARSALWDKIIHETVPDEGMRLAYQQFCGAFLIDRTEHKFEYICFLVGEGQNGKSIVAKAIVNVFRNEDENGIPVTKCITTFTPEQLFKSNQMDYHMAEVNGKIMNYCDDVSDKDFSGGDFKAFVSGGEFTGRAPYSKEPTYVTKIPIMLCCANKIPPTTDDSDGYFRRFLIINCPNKVSEKDRDPQLEAKLRDDKVRAAIFNWMVVGYRQLLGNDCKIDMSDAVKALKEDMKADSNSARRWIRECGLVAVEPSGPSDPDWKSLKEWMGLYKQYCSDYGEAPKTAKSVSKIFNELGFISERRSNGTWYCIGERHMLEPAKPTSNEDTSAFGTASNEEDLPF